MLGCVESCVREPGPWIHFFTKSPREPSQTALLQTACSSDWGHVRKAAHVFVYNSSNIKAALLMHNMKQVPECLINRKSRERPLSVHQHLQHPSSGSNAQKSKNKAAPCSLSSWRTVTLSTLPPPGQGYGAEPPSNSQSPRQASGRLEAPGPATA